MRKLAWTCACTLVLIGGCSASRDLSGDHPELSVEGDLSGSGDLSVLDGNDSQCVPPQTAAVCPNPIASNAGCVAHEDCGTDGTGNGLDDDCNGLVDDTCTCSPGQVKHCFLGPPGKRNIGACTDGTMTCQGVEFGSWGPCGGGISPSAESCDKLDNDCNGCKDDTLCCVGLLDCPAPGDARIAPVAPYTDVTIDGTQFFNDSGATNWKWTVDGGPCDQLFKTTTGTPPSQSFTLTGANTAMPTVHFTLSGEYTITFTVTGSNGATFTCTWVQQVMGPGVRFELCWDHSGDDDLDLHVHRSDTTTSWFTPTPTGSNVNPDDCYYRNCKADNYPTGTAQPVWGYNDSAIGACIGSPSGIDWQLNLNACHNPRLDIDNVSDIGVPENTNIDRPKNGESFRAMIHFYGGFDEVHPLVNVYCGGSLKASYGGAPNQLGPCPGATCFDHGDGFNAGLMWRVADVTATVDLLGNTTGCTVTPIHPPGTTSGYYVTSGDNTF